MKTEGGTKTTAGANIPAKPTPFFWSCPTTLKKVVVKFYNQSFTSFIIYSTRVCIVTYLYFIILGHTTTAVDLFWPRFLFPFSIR